LERERNKHTMDESTAASWFGDVSYLESFVWGAVAVVVIISVRNLFRTSSGVDTNNNQPLPPVS
jgi:hypothetical protein